MQNENSKSPGVAREHKHAAGGHNSHSHGHHGHDADSTSPLPDAFLAVMSSFCETASKRFEALSKKYDKAVDTCDQVCLLFCL